MKPLYFLLWSFLFLFACKADPSIVPDEETPPAIPEEPFKCDSLPVPNSHFSNAVGEVLVFMDSTGLNSDTLVCVANEAHEERIITHMVDYCEPRFYTAFETKWLPAPEIYAIEFRKYYSNARHFSASSTSFYDFSASALGAESVYPIDSFQINGKAYFQIWYYGCTDTAPCTFVDAFVIKDSIGLIAFHRQDKWWVKK